MDSILYEKANGIGVLTLNRPEVMNAVNFTLIEETRSVVADVANDPDVGVLVLTGNGRGFCAGADLASPSPTQEGNSRGQNVAYSMEIGFNPMIQEIHDLQKPVISAVNGTTAGGGVGLALSADIVVAARSASFIQVFAPKLALIPDMGCTWLVPQRIGMERAKYLALTGEKLSAEKAEAWGLISKCVDDEMLMPEVMALAEKLAAGPVNAFAESSAAIEHSFHNTLQEQLDYERIKQGEMGDHDNFAEGVMAFLKKRAPEFKR